MVLYAFDVFVMGKISFKKHTQPSENAFNITSISNAEQPG